MQRGFLCWSYIRYCIVNLLLKVLYVQLVCNQVLYHRSIWIRYCSLLLILRKGAISNGSQILCFINWSCNRCIFHIKEAYIIRIQITIVATLSGLASHNGTYLSHFTPIAHISLDKRLIANLNAHLAIF